MTAGPGLKRMEMMEFQLKLKKKTNNIFWGVCANDNLDKLNWKDSVLSKRNTEISPVLRLWRTQEFGRSGLKKVEGGSGGSYSFQGLRRRVCG